MLPRNAGYVITIAPFIALLHSACATVPPSPPPAPGERPAEIVLPPPNSFGNAARVRVNLAQFSRGEEHRHERRATCPDCMVKVTIKSVGLTRDIIPLNGPRQFRIVGWIKNTDRDHTEEMYNLKPDTEYLMWIDTAATINRAGDSRTIWGTVELPLVTGALKLDTIGYVRRCPNKHAVPSTVSDADFKTCEMSHAPARTVTQAARFTDESFGGAHSPSPTNLYVVGGGWFDCGGYCCSGTSQR